MIEYIKLAVFFVCGIYLHNRIPPSFALICLISLIMVLTIKAVFKHSFNIKILSAAFMFALGIVICSYAISDNTKDLSEYKGRYVTLTGRISEIPTESEDNVQYVVDVRRVFHNGAEKKVKENVILTAASGYKYGDTVTFCGFLDALPIKMNENGFDFRMYYKSKDIFFKIYSDDIRIADEKITNYSPYAIGMNLKNFISYIIDNNYKGDYNAIMKAALTGNKKEFSEDFNSILVRTGTRRYFYPAFLHVMLFMTVITFALGIFGKRKRDIITVFLLIIYASVNFSNNVFVKLIVMLILFTFLKYRFGHIYYLDVLGMTAIIFGILNPLAYYDSGFIMSMLSSLMIYYFFDHVYAKLKFVKIRYFRRLLTIGIICTIGLIPVAAYLFNSVSIYSILLSAVMIPCVFVIVILSPVLILLYILFRTAPVIHQAISFMLFILKYVPVLADKLNLTNTYIAKPDILFLIIYMFVIIAAVKYVRNKKYHAKISLFVAAALMMSVFISEIAGLGNIEITFVNVGQGDGAVISAPYRFNILIDGGGGNVYSDYNPGEAVYLEYLKKEGITKVDSAFVSHYHQDHVQGIIAAMENIKVRNLFLPDNMEGNEWRSALETAAMENGTTVHYISKETLLTYNNGMTIRIIPPSEKTKTSDDENDTTYVYRLEYGEFSAMFTGDITSFAEKNLIAAGKADEADLLKTAHHGSKTSTSPEWVETVRPKYAVISVGENNTYALPNSEVLDNLEDSEIYRTDYDGDITFTVGKNGKTKIQTFNRR